MPGKSGHRGWGHIRRLPSGRFQASYVGPDMRRHTALTTYSVKLAAEGWLADERRLIESYRWSPPATRDAEHKA
ncbi:MAG: integrase, partial [Candidatus Sericytochromatia bacterium]